MTTLIPPPPPLISQKSPVEMYPIPIRSPEGFNIMPDINIPKYPKPTPEELYNPPNPPYFYNAQFDLSDLIPFMYFFSKPLILDHNTFNILNIQKDTLKKKIAYTSLKNEETFRANDIKIALFNIYDNGNFLNPKYGSSYNEFIKTASEFNKILVNKNIEKPLYYYNSNYDIVIDNMIILHNFLNKETDNNTLIISLGSKYHATCLVLTKIYGTNITKVVHVNTGLGLEASNITHNNKKFYDLFEKHIYLTPEMHNSFILFLKPFFFFREADVENNKHLDYEYAIYVLSDYCERFLNLDINENDFNHMSLFYNKSFSSIYDYYMYIYEIILKDSFNTFPYLNEVFNYNIFTTRLQKLNISFVPESIPEISQYNTNFNNNSYIFYNSWINEKEKTIKELRNDYTNFYKANYLEKAFENIDFYFNNKLYITSQVAGTCVFKSLLVSIMYYIINYNTNTNPLLTYECYLTFSNNCFDNLMNKLQFPGEIDKHYYQQFINIGKICSKLIKDNIIKEDYYINNIILTNRNNLYINKSEIYYKKVDSSAINNTYEMFVSTIPMDILNNLLEDIRQKKEKKNLEDRIIDIINAYLKNMQYNDILRTYYELILIGLVWELYYNYEIWEKVINSNTNYNLYYNNLIFLYILRESKSRIEFTTNEINWICKLLYYFMYNYENLKSTEILQFILEIDKITNETNLHDMYIYNSSLDKPEYDSSIPTIPKPIKICLLFKNFNIYALQTQSSNYHIYNKENIVDLDKLNKPLYSLNKSDTLLNYINLYIDYLFSKNYFINNKRVFPSYLLDNEISDINRFFINYLKNETDFYIELENSIKIEAEKLADIIHDLEAGQDIENNKNIYILFALIQIYLIYSVYLTNNEKYRVLKEIFINCKPILKNPVYKIVYGIIIKILRCVNSILNDIYLFLEQQDNLMTYEMGSYENTEKHSSILYDNEGSKKQQYILNDVNFIIFLYEKLLNLFENNQEINKNAIDLIILHYKYQINSPYFKINTNEPTKMDLIINNETKTFEFDEFNSVESGYHMTSYNTYYFLLGTFLLNDGKNKGYINKEKTYMVFVLKKDNYKNKYGIDTYMPYDVIIAFELLPSSTEGYSVLIGHNIYINSNQAILGGYAYLHMYPFIAHASENTINIIEKNNNNYIVHCISNSINDKTNDFYNIINKEEDNYYVSFQIKPNYLTPYIDQNKINYLNIFYQNHEPKVKYINKMFDSSINMLNYDKMIELINMPGVDILSKSSNAVTYIGKILSDTNNNVTKIITSILDKDKVKYIDLITWINNNTDNSITPYNADLECKMECSIISKDPFKKKIKDILLILNKLLQILTSKLNHNYSTYFEFLYHNYVYCCFIMQTNIYISALERLLRAIKTCETVLCHELLEINEIFTKRFDNVSILAGMVEIIFGNIIKNEQWGKIYSMFNDYKTRTDKWNVHQFMMGKGKSSIITPMLITLIHYANHDTNNNIILCVPEHLKIQTHNTITEFKYYFGINPEILSDSDIKLKFLNNRYELENKVLLIDEFDYMYNPIQSNFNLIELSIDINPEVVEKIFKITHDIRHRGRIFQNPKPFGGINEIISILNDTNNIKKISYGMSIKDDYRYCIPYLRKDSPNEGSKFSSILLTIVLTILYFYNDKYRKYILEEKDIKLIFNNSKQIFYKLKKLYNIDENLEPSLGESFLKYGIQYL